MNMEEVPIIARIDGKAIQIRANLNWTIYQLKQHLYLHCDKKADDLKIVFAGSEINNSVLLKNCYLAQGTVVHVIVDSKSNKEGLKSIVSTNFVAPTTEGIEIQQTTASRRAKFYIFCKLNCNQVRAGKLRVRCHCCKDEAFEINKGPNSWQDVLIPAKVDGKCNNSSGCEGNLAEFYFKCEGVHDEAGGQSALPLSLLRTNTVDVPCLACTDIGEIVLVFPCQDNHVMCVDCFSTYCQVKLDQRGFVLTNNIGYTLPCPGLGDSCSTAYIEDIHHFLIAGKQQYERYKNFATEEFVLQNGGILCPGDNCGNGLMVEDDTRRVVCYRSKGGCGHVFCRNCRNAYHEEACQENHRICDAQSSEDYMIDSTRAQQARWVEDIASANVIERTSKRCPGCNTPTEKSGGCNHMTCSRCQLEWCWLCLIPWGRRCEGDHWFRAA